MFARVPLNTDEWIFRPVNFYAVFKKLKSYKIYAKKHLYIFYSLALCRICSNFYNENMPLIKF